MHSTEGSRDPAPVGMARAGFSFNHPFSPFAHRGGRFIVRIFPVLHVSRDGQERNQLNDRLPNKARPKPSRRRLPRKMASKALCARASFELIEPLNNGMAL
jgi:hypothetical protein